MNKVTCNQILMEKILSFCDMNLIISLSKMAKKYNLELFDTIDSLVWKKKCQTDFAITRPSYYDLYCALSNENNMKRRYHRIRKKYIEVANCCKCRVYCRSCAKPMSDSDDVELKCPYCDEINNIDEFEILHRREDNIIRDRGSLSYVCKECRPMYPPCTIIDGFDYM